MFPLSLQGEISIDNLQQAEIDAAIARLQSAVSAMHARNIERLPNGLSFRGGLFRVVSSWNILIPFDNCEISVAPNRIYYDFSMRELLVATTLMMAGMWALMHFSASPAPLTAQIVAPVIGWIWIFGMNVVTGERRIRRFLECSIRQE
jgi:hypothetical protein